jgi:DNA-binding NarL/FixJ family response regulator
VERERANSHILETERILAVAPSLAAIGRLSGTVHERLDGTGYPHARNASSLDAAARVLAAADAYQGLLEERAHRPAYSADEAAMLIAEEAKAGRLDAYAAAAVAECATGGVPKRSSSQRAGGLTEREVEVLRLMARGLTNREIADSLVISPRTVQQHTIHIYDKCGVSNRAAATLFAAEHEIFTHSRYD